MRINVITPTDAVSNGISAKSIRNVLFWNIERLKQPKQEAKISTGQTVDWDIDRVRRQISLLIATHDQMPGQQPFKKAH